MTNIRVDLNVPSNVVESQSEISNNWLAAFLSSNNLLAALGTNDERTQGYMLIESPADLYSRLNATYDTGWYIPSGLVENDGEDGSTIEYINTTPDKYNPNNQLESSWPGGPDFLLDGEPTGFQDDFHSVANYLQYGGRCFVSGSIDNLPETTNNGKSVIENTTETINCVFTTNYIQNSTIRDIVKNRTDCMAILQVDVSAPVSSTTPNGLPTEDEQDRTTFHVTGRKVHLGSSSTFTGRNDNNPNIITTGIAADVAGRMATNSVSSSPYGSPAGIERGKILGAIKMQYDLTSADREELELFKVNPVRSFPGTGICLFGDTTGHRGPDTIFNYTNVELTYLNINRQVSEIITQFLFLENSFNNRASLTTGIQSILRRVLIAGGLTAYSVTCNEINNPPDVVETGKLIVGIELKFYRSVQSIFLNYSALSGNQTIRSSTSSTSGSSSSSTSSTSSSGGSSY